MLLELIIMTVVVLNKAKDLIRRQKTLDDPYVTYYRLNMGFSIMF